MNVAVLPGDIGAARLLEGLVRVVAETDLTSSERIKELPRALHGDTSSKPRKVRIA